ncbi:MAG: hypothetical protein V1777_04705 [Candidatus Micrarchaeota archaeon]
MAVNTQSVWINRLFVFILFLLSYALLWFIGTSLISGAWNSPMHWLIPIAGFWLAYFSIHWSSEYFEIKSSSLWYPFVIAVLGLAAFYFSQFLYWCNAFTDIRGLNTSCGGTGVTQAVDFVGKGFWDLLSRDAFFYFALAVLLAWISKLVLSLAMGSPSESAAKKTKKKK